MPFQRDNIHFILVRSQFASNLGSTVRVMKNMGFKNLILVQPQCEIGVEARSYAMKGSGILDEALFLPTLEATAKRVGLLVGTTGRYHGRNPRVYTPRSFLEEVAPAYSESSLGVVIGSEDNGLRREELRLCNWLIEIPTASDYPVINLAQAAAILAYEFSLSALPDPVSKDSGRTRSAPLEPLLGRIGEVLRQADLGTRLSVDRLMLRIRKIAARAQLDREDINMLHGLLKEFSRKRDRPGE